MAYKAAAPCSCAASQERSQGLQRYTGTRQHTPAVQLPEVSHTPLAVHVAEGDPPYPSLQRTAQVAPSAYDVPQADVLPLVKLSVPQETENTVEQQTREVDLPLRRTKVTNSKPVFCFPTPSTPSTRSPTARGSGTQRTSLRTRVLGHVAHSALHT